MARIEIKISTTLHGVVAVAQHFDELTVTSESGEPATACVAKAVRSAGEAIARAHGESLESEVK